MSCAVSSSEALTISEKRLKMLKLEKPIQDKSKTVLNSTRYEISDQGKATPKDLPGKLSIKSTSPLVTPANFTKGPNFSNKTTDLKSNKAWEMFTKVNAIGIRIECKGCVTYEDLKKYDTAPAVLGTMTPKGRIDYSDNPEWLRSINQTVIILDPPYKTMQKIKMINIVSQMPAVNSTLTGSDVTFYHTRYTDPQCMRSIITGSNLIPVLEDTIQYLKSDCKQTKLTSKTTTALAKSEIKLSESAQYQALKKLQAAKECARTAGCKL
jgi:hypothetical protein